MGTRLSSKASLSLLAGLIVQPPPNLGPPLTTTAITGSLTQTCATPALPHDGRPALYPPHLRRAHALDVHVYKHPLLLRDLVHAPPHSQLQHHPRLLPPRPARHILADTVPHIPRL